MKSHLFSCNSRYYYDILNITLSDDEEFERFLDTNKKNELYYFFEKAVNKIIIDTKKSCDISSDFEEVEKLEYKKNEVVDSDCIDDIDIILQKSKCKNMFLKKYKNDNIIKLPPKSIKQRIYSVNQEKAEMKHNKRDQNKNDKIIENFKNVLCNDLNKYFKDILENVKKNNETHNQSNNYIKNAIHTLNDSIKINSINALKDNIKDCVINCNNNKHINYFFKDNTKNLNYNNIYANENIYDDNGIIKVDRCERNGYINKKNFKENNYNINLDTNTKHNQNNVLKKKTYKKRKTSKKKKSVKNFHFSKKKVSTKENKFNPYHFNNFYSLKNSKPKNILTNNQNIETLNCSNISLNQLICNNDKLNIFKNLRNSVEAKDSSCGNSNEDFTFNHFQKNANNNILNKLLF
ncbi:conserved Plasmodium protein, unknown function [Plasmodium gallinaceum]|uniref:Uncharacterized protein n=1 Tax=Plasmodium gallinaceum TaxID=5849 RepID=A0A1J1GSM8_PLAGA|nr:conserved Plasmodium protein, unknown function [Plasmodium gallinaceum]CRG94051.1 conserved Plasmodium protein, unknown function [Plasmodium gallinaceum]